MPIVELPRTGPADLEELEGKLAADPAGLNYTTLQCVSSMFADVDQAVLRALDQMFARWPELGLRLYSAIGREPVNVSGLASLPNLRHLKLHYSIPALVDVAPLCALTHLETAELEVHAAYPLGDVLEAWPKLRKLSLIREGKASKAVDLSGLSGLAMLQDLYIMGYDKGIGALADCHALRRLTLQSLKLPSWDELPVQKMEFLQLNAVKGPDPVPFAALLDRADDVRFIRMDRDLPFKRDSALSKVSRDGWFVVHIDYLNGFFDDERSGHDWADVLQKACPPPEGVAFDPEAGSFSVIGTREDLVRYQERVVPALAALVQA